MHMMTRRTAIASMALAPFAPSAAKAQANPGGLPRIVVRRDPDCGCCGGWIDHLRANGFSTDVVMERAMNPVKARLGVPPALQSCHTAEIGRYVVEGHVPAVAIKRLLNEAPEARGLAVPAMPIGSPGMEIDGQPPETYEVILFGPAGQRTFARFRGGEEIKG